MANPLLVVFVHGWSVTNTDTYGELPARLKREAGKDGGPPLDVRIVLYLEGAISAAAHEILDYVEPNQATLVDIVLTRVVRSGVFTFTRQLAPRSFKNDAFGNPV